MSESDKKKIADEKKKKQKAEEDLVKKWSNYQSEDDKALKDKISVLVEQIKENNQGVSDQALNSLINEVKSATTSMTSIPKPFRFLKDHYQDLVDFYETVPQSEFKVSAEN